VFVSSEALREFTGKERPTAQAKFLRDRLPGVLFFCRDDGTIALRQEEFDRYTLAKAAPVGKRRKTLDLELLRKTG
jgi:hypothetical protein